MTANPGAPNADQITYWNEGAAPAWVALQDRLDWQLAPLSRAGIAVLAPAAGERIIDIGCGCGATSLDLGNAVGADGAVLGVDISAPMLAVARRRAVEAGQSWVRFEEADAQINPFEAGAFDAVFSRFGVMFFADPTAAFANIRTALRPGGRLGFVCWRAPDESPVMTLPLQVSLKHFDAPPPPADPQAPGPFAFANPERLRGILSGAGFSDIALRPHDEAIGGRTVEDVIDVSLRVGPLGRMVREAPDKREAAIASVREALTPYITDRGVLLPSATWIATATKL